MATTEAELRLKRSHRRGQRAQLQRLMDETGILLNQQPLPIDDLQGNLNSFDRITSALQELDNYISYAFTSEDAIDADIKESGDIQQAVCRLTAKVRRALASIENNSESSVHSSHTIHRSPTSFRHHPQRQFPKLPQLELPRFSGDPLQWTSFWDSFESAIYQPSMPDVDKFNYLKSFLKGVALDAISGISVSNTTYDTAITIIKQRFGQPQIIINAHVENLISIPRSTSDTTSLRKLHDSVEIHIRGLESLDITATTYGKILTPILLSKLPPDIRLIITRKHGSAVGDLNILRDLLKVEIEARELSEENVGQHPSHANHQPSEFSTGALVLPSKNDVCVFCKSNNHSTFFCKTFSSPSARRSKLVEEKRCFNCLRQEHNVKSCPVSRSCQRCDLRHHTSLCNRPAYSPRANQPIRNFTSQSNRNFAYQSRQGDRPFNQRQRPYSHANQSRQNTSAHLTHNPDANDNYHYQEHQTDFVSPPSQTLLSTSGSILMQTALAHVKDTYGSSHVVRLLFDTGSQRSYVSSRITRMLGLKPNHSESLAISPFGQRSSATRSYDVTSIKCLSMHNSSGHSIIAVVVPTITHPVTRSALPQFFSSRVANLVLADPSSMFEESLTVDILVGLDYYWDIVKDKVIRIPDTRLTAIPSSFGYLLSGKVQSGTSSSFNALLVGISAPNSEDFVKNFWESESFDVQDAHVRGFKEVDPVLLHFNDTIHMKDGRYEVRLPWKEDEPDLPTNFQLANDRFQSLVTRLQKKDLMSAYNDIIQQQLRSNFIERVDPGQSSEGVLHYISHHPVIRMDHTTTKVRIVYDASAKQSSQHKSLNDCLHSGPNLLNDIHRLLLEFRTYKIVLLSDVEKAFLQVGLIALDRDATRFFWLKNHMKPARPDNIEVFRFRRVPFGATSSPFLLAATLRHHLNQSQNPIVKSLAQNFYVDNLSVGVSSVKEAQQLYIAAKQSLREAGMNLREWVSNSKEFITSLPPEDRAKGSSAKVLGVPWNIPDDTLTCQTISDMNQSSVFVTKRRILQVISTVFDPLGLVTPIVVTAKIFIQDLWKDGLDWDNKVSPVFLTKWKSISKELSLITTISVPRLIPISSQAELHVFVDASQQAYGAAAYVRVNGSATAHLLCSKSRVAPVKSVTIPRLELVAAVMGCKLATFIVKCIPQLAGKVQIWSDSQVVLHWIKGSHQKLDVFVKNRVTQLRTYAFNFSYCATLENPADLCTRGSSTGSLKVSQLWWHCPSWLSKPKSKWPEYPLSPDVINPVNLYSSIPCTILKTQAESDAPSAPYGMDLHRYSSLDRLLKVTAYCNRFIKRLRGHFQVIQTSPTSDELDNAKIIWIKWLQQSLFQKEKTLINKGLTNSTIKELSLFISEGLIRCQGRFQSANVPSSFISPMLLPKNHYFTDLVIKHCHNKLAHQGVRHTLTSLRQQFWIPGGRQQVKFVIQKCLVCRYWEGPSFSTPQLPPLPASRVSQSPPFTYTGCDFAGPVYVFDKDETYKAYICMFTCAVTRAVHLELVGDMSTGTFILALRRFISRRGVPKQIISDNAKTFKLAKTIMEGLWNNVKNSNEFTSYIASNGIIWRFIVERAPWWGGFYERLIGLVKRALIKATGKTKLTSIQLTTVLTEIEAILNSRPLTYVYSENEAGQPLTPNCFLMSSCSGVPTATMDPDPDFKDVTANSLITKLQYTQKVVDFYWSIWQTEYLSHLREFHHQWQKRSKACSRVPSVGDVVLIKEDGIKRGNWKIAIIQKVYRGSDDAIRSVQVKCKTTTLQRPVSLLYPLELNAGPTTDPTPEVSSRPQRQAGQKAKILIKECLKIEDS